MLAENQILCPHCKQTVSLSDALTHQLEEKVRAKYQAHLSKAQGELKAREAKLEADAEAMKRTLASEREAQALKLTQQLALERRALEQKLRGELGAQLSQEVEDLRTQAEETRKKLAEAQTNELTLRKKARELEDREKAMELELTRKLDESRAKLTEEAATRVAEEYRMKTAEKDKQLEDMRRQIDDLRRKSEQGSQQTQGEVLELEFEASLKARFPLDSVEPVAKGVRGGDIVQRIQTASGTSAGTILWEMKRTKSWSDSWIDKLKDDQRAISAELAVIVTLAMPKGVTHMTEIQGVWVVEPAVALALGHALRANLISLHQSRASSVGKGEKMEVMYSYLTGTQFKQRVEAIVESFKSMQEDLEREKRAFQKIWASRQQQIDRVITNTVGMYGDIQGIVGATLPRIESLELEGQPALLSN
ncbi:MAG: DUF2130 domain-containing protein [Bdellovibrionota bacterium]